MTKPLNQEVAEKYGYGEESFRGWATRYIDSLKLDTLNFKPINLGETLDYVININDKSFDVNDKYFLLDAGYIYLLASKRGKNTHYIPVSEPFYYQKRNAGPKMDGLYVVKKDLHTYTTKGLDKDTYYIIGVAPFPKTETSRFLNWNGNPLP